MHYHHHAFKGTYVHNLLLTLHSLLVTNVLSKDRFLGKPRKVFFLNQPAPMDLRTSEGIVEFDEYSL